MIMIRVDKYGVVERLASDAFLRIVKVAETSATDIFRIMHLNLKCTKRLAIDLTANHSDVGSVFVGFY